MATRPSKASAPTADESTSVALAPILTEIRALRADVAALRDELLAQGRRRTARPKPGHDPGDAVPPGVAVQEPAPLTAEDREARRSLERLSRKG